MQNKLSCQSRQDLGFNTASAGRETWPIIGIVGATCFGLGAFLLAWTLAGSAPSHAASMTIGTLLAVGGALLGTAWCGALKRGHGGVGAICGSFVVPLALIHLFTSDLQNADSARVEVLVVAGAFVWFALGLALARGLAMARVFAIAALAAIGTIVVATFAGWALGTEDVRFLAQATFGALGVACVALVVELPRLRDAPEQMGAESSYVA